MIFIENKILLKIFVVIVILCGIIFSFSNIYAKYVFKNEFCIANINIDRTRPKIEMVYIDNSNVEDKEYANKYNSLLVGLKIIDKNLKEVFLDKKYVNVQIGKKTVDDVNIKISEIKNIKNGKIVDVMLENFQENGVIKLKILGGMAIDRGGLENEILEIDTGVIIDNDKLEFTASTTNNTL